MARPFICVLLVCCLMIIGGCGGSTYLLETPRKFESCMNMGKNVRQQSFDTIWDLLNKMRGWRIDSVNKDQFMIDATVYRGRAFIPMLISVNKQGAVEIIRNPNEPREISLKWGRTLMRWMDNLEARYAQKRCS